MIFIFKKLEISYDIMTNRRKEAGQMAELFF
jgi:hypothetical protein